MLVSEKKKENYENEKHNQSLDPFEVNQYNYVYSKDNIHYQMKFGEMFMKVKLPPRQ
jgi:asparagine N-glycosylation enzyme membrane subunit Stt3